MEYTALGGHLKFVIFTHSDFPLFYFVIPKRALSVLSRYLCVSQSLNQQISFPATIAARLLRLAYTTVVTEKLKMIVLQLTPPD